MYRRMDDQRVADYFVVAGLNPLEQLPLEEFSNEAITKPSSRLEPITDITVINRSLGEKVPKGYDCIEQTPTGYPANLNHGSLRCPDMFICYKRGRDKPPLKDLGILYEGKERVMEGCEVVSTTFEAHPANVNNSNSSRTYITFRRAEKNEPSDTLYVVDICVILGNRGEEPPLTFLKIFKNLNKGMLGSDVYLCYKKAMVKTDVLSYKADILGRYPVEDYADFPLPPTVPMFCLPMGATIECWALDAQHPLPNFSTFILTGAKGEKAYGAAVSFYEEYKEEDLTDLQMRTLGLKNRQIRQKYSIQKTVHVRKSIALLSHWPFFDAFKKFLSQLYKISITGPHNVPIERHISHFMFDVPFPSPERPRILVQLAHDSLSLSMFEDSPLPLSGASFITLLRNLGPELTMNLLLFVLLENKILLHSLRPTVLTEVAEAVSTMIFPFHWQCPYIPLCPLTLSDVLNAPIPFIVGVDSRYFDLYDPPPDVICVDLDTSRISPPEDKKILTYKLLPKKPTRVLQESLSRLYDQVSSANINKLISEEFSMEISHFEIDFRRRKKVMQLESAIQEVFLRFTASLLKDYKNFLNPIQQVNRRTTDASCLFDMQGFLKSRDKANAKFYSQMMRTQMFFRFIEERSFVSDKDVGLAFFDECTEKVDESKDEPKLIEMDYSQMSERTVFILPPEPVGLPEGVKYSYNGFPELKQELFLTKKKDTLNVPNKPVCPSSPLARRTKQEIKTAQKVARQQAENPKSWAKCLLSYCYSLWFVVFPSFVQNHPRKQEALKIGYAVMKKMQEAKLTTVDELCYRVLMQLAGQFNKPGMAVQVLDHMKKHGVHPNAITYGYYNKVMLEATTSSEPKGTARWLKLRNVIFGVAQFRRAARRRSLSINSNSGSEYDRISHTSAESFLGESQAAPTSANAKTSDCTSQLSPDGHHVSEDSLNKITGSLEERMSTGGVSDRGYNSMTQEDVKRLSQIVIAVNDRVTTSSPVGSEGKPKAAELWNPISVSSGASEKPKQHLEKVKKEVHINNDRVKHHTHRPRVGSIVKRSISSAHPSHRDEFEVYKSTLMNNSCGLIILSKVCVEKNSYLPDTDLRLQVEEAKRRRHRSAGESHAKPSRSMSLFASWRPPRPSTGQGQNGEEPSKLVFNFAELTKKEEDDSELIAAGEGSQVMSGSTSSENSNTLVQSINTSEDSRVPSSTGGLHSEVPLSISGSHPLDDGYSPLTLISSKAAATSSKQDIILGNSLLVDTVVSSQTTQTPDHSSALTNCNNKDSLPSNARVSPSHVAPVASGDNINLRRSMSIPEDRLSGQFNDTFIKQSLSETGPTLSSPASDKKTEVRPLAKPVPEDAQSVSSLTDSKMDKAADFMFRRTHSLKKTNEAIGSFLKYASKAAFTKLNELKNTIATPIKNGSLGSLGSLTHSIEELDVNDDSSTSGTIRERMRHGGSQDLLSNSEKSDVTDEADKRMSGLSFESVPSSACLEEYSKYKETPGQGLGSSMEKLSDELIKVAMEVEMSSCSRCTKCNRLIYDEEIMAGWSAEDSNLNTSCPYCHAKFVPHLQIYIKDWRDENKSVAVSTEQSYPSKEKLLAGTDHLEGSLLSTPGKVAAESASTQSCLERGDMPLTFEEAAETIRRRCTSENLSTSDHAIFGSSLNSPTHYFQRSPLSLSIEEESEQGGSASEKGAILKDLMSRSASSSEPIVLPYLSPLVLRKEVEFVLDHESNMCLANDSFVEEHPIIFWNLVWFFRRIGIPTHLTGFLLTSKAFNCSKPDNNNKNKGSYTSRNIHIRPQWDNVRIHDEIGLPMYLAWRAGDKSTVVDALVIESDSFSRPIMWQIISSIKRNDMVSAMKAVVAARKKIASRKRRFRSMYREILFLSFAECGRENIDHDAFDREYAHAFEDKFQRAEVLRLQPDDHPKASNVQWCRKAFGELEV